MPKPVAVTVAPVQVMAVQPPADHSSPAAADPIEADSGNPCPARPIGRIGSHRNELMPLGGSSAGDSV